MASILEEFFDKEFLPRDRSIDNPKYKQISDRKGSYIQMLEGNLDEKQNDIFKQIYTAEMEMVCIEKDEFFMRGFRTGARMMIEILRESDKA